MRTATAVPASKLIDMVKRFERKAREVRGSPQATIDGSYKRYRNGLGSDPRITHGDYSGSRFPFTVVLCVLGCRDTIAHEKFRLKSVLELKL